jgi:hypothetical protein
MKLVPLLSSQDGSGRVQAEGFGPTRNRKVVGSNRVRHTLSIARWPVAVAHRDSAYSGACRQARRHDYCGRCQAASEALPSGSACSTSKPRPGRGRTLLLTASWSHTLTDRLAGSP